MKRVGLFRLFPKAWHCVAASALLGLAAGYGIARNVVDPADRDGLRRCLADLKLRPEVQVVFRKLHLDPPGRDGPAESMTGKLRFTVSVDGELKGEYAARVSVPVGNGAASSGPAVDAPLGYAGPFDQRAFREDAVRYIRRALGTCETSGDRLAGSASAATSDLEIAEDWTTTFRATPPQEKTRDPQ